MKIGAFILFFAIYLVSSTFTHFQWIPNVFSADARRIGVVIALREAAIMTLLLLVSLRLWLSRNNNSDKLVYGFVALLSAALILRLAGSSASGNSEILVAIRVTILVMLTLLTPYAFTGNPLYPKYGFYMVGALLLVQLFVVPLQILWMPGYYGSTFLGSRPVGTFASPLHLSLFCGAAAVVFVSQRFRYWRSLLAIALFTAMASGGRAGFIVCVVAVMWAFEPRVRKNYGTVAAFMFILPLAGLALYEVASNTAISGRDDTETGVAGEARWLTWALVLQRGFHDANLGDWLWGLGLGVGSNSAASVASGFKNISDSTFIFLLQSYGIVGMTLLVLAAAYFWRSSAKLSYLALVSWFICANTQVLVELHPTNLILLSALAAPVSTRRRVPVPQAKINDIDPDVMAWRAPARAQLCDDAAVLGPRLSEDNPGG